MSRFTWPTRLARCWSRFVLQASPLRTGVETLLLFIGLLAFTQLVYQRTAGDMTTPALLFWISPCCALYYSARLRIPAGQGYRPIVLDTLWLLIPILFFNPIVWLMLRNGLLGVTGYGGDLRAVDGLNVALLAFPYLFFRVGVRVILWWNEVRQRRVMWSLVTSNLIAVALLQMLVALPLAIILVFSGISLFSPPPPIPDTLLAQFLYRLQITLPSIGLAMLAATVILIALLPVSILVSYFFARGIGQRLEVLLTAAHAARDGDYETQIQVSGQDEIARLQADFNGMTANLKINIDRLHDEQKKIAALLKNRRELMADVSHELRTPIATVRPYLESALQPPDHSGEVTLSHQDLAVMQREMLRLQTLIDDLFLLARAEVDQLVVHAIPVNGIGLIQRVVETVAPSAWRVNRVVLAAQLPAELPEVIGDETRLEQVLRNLIHNSIRHTAPGGLIMVRAREVGGCVEIQVQDTGEGISPEQLPHIWERYYRDKDNGGTGLGLTVVKSFVEAMRGQVTVTSTVGEGTCFTITLPLADASSESSPQPVPVPCS